MNDSELDQLLKDTDTTVPPPAGFQRDVWSRIEAADADGWKPRASRVLERFLGFFALPSVAVATCAAMVTAGAWFGLNAGSPDHSGEITYAQSISPFAQTHR